MVWLIADLLIGVGLIGLGIWAAVPFAPPSNVGDALETQASLVVISRHLEAFQDAHGRYPSAAEGLAALAGGSKSSPSGSFPETDSWGSRWIYRLPAERSGDSADLYSAGLNRIDDAGRGDDLRRRTPLTHPAYRPGFSLEHKVLAVAAGFLILGVVLRLVYRN